MEADAERTAYHEAGHAVMALALGRAVDHVSIQADALRLGHCEFRKPVFRPSEDWLEREMLISLAGPAAESLYAGVYDEVGASFDFRQAEAFALQRTGNARQAGRLTDRTLSKAEHLLSKPAHWRAVARLAAELLRVGALSGRAARHFFEQSLKEDE